MVRTDSRITDTQTTPRVSVENYSTRGLKPSGTKRGIFQEPFSRTYYLGQKSLATYGTGPFIDKMMSNLLCQTPKYYI